MIQRIQSVFLLLGAVCIGALFFLPFAGSDKATSQFLSDKIYDVNDHIILGILAGAACILSMVALFLFKNRSLQLRIAIFAIIATVLLAVTAIVLFYNEANSMAADASVQDMAGTYLPVGAIVLLGLAVRFIKKDSDLVSSMDRLR